jgi:DNA repair exonuclease SbcCD ATPase subunit
MIKFKTLTVKNFMSVGNVTQAINFEGQDLTLVLGQNIDLGGDDAGSRNGTGKTTILNALSFALFGDALTNIKRDNLVNKTNEKNMLVSCEFEINGKKYKIERGRKPALIKFYVNGLEETDDEAQGDSRETQKDITKLLGMSHIMFQNIVALHTYAPPFFGLKAAEQKDIIEQLLGITVLSEKADVLKDEIKDTKEIIKEEEIRLTEIERNNEKIQSSIDALETRQRGWRAQHKEDIDKLTLSLEELMKVDIKEEIEKHKKLETYRENYEKKRTWERELATVQTALKQSTKQLTDILESIDKTQNKTCPTCGGAMEDGKHQSMVSKLETDKSEFEKYIEDLVTQESGLLEKIQSIGDLEQPETYYDTAQQAYKHENTVEYLGEQLESKTKETDPYQEQIDDLKTSAVQELSYDKMNSLRKLQDHQEFLFKLLTSKDSFVRKKVIDQNLTYLNSRLAFYLSKTGLPHKVVFLSDLTVEITEMGRDLDFDNLSRGERNRLILSLCWAFRDVWEMLYHSINTMFIDELVDSGMDTAGVENAISILKQIARERHKNIYLISHRDELQGRVNNVLKVTKENGFTSYAFTDTVT